MQERSPAHAAPIAPTELDDVALIELTRSGDTTAYAELYDRYEHSAVRLARHLGQREDAGDVAAEAFARILDLLQRGKGPDREFRAYLFTTIRHEAGSRAKVAQRVRPTDDEGTLDRPVPFGAGRLDGFEQTTVRAAYESLPDRWRAVLWHLDVEGRKPHELADVLGLQPNSVSALVYRARSGLRDAYLQQHVNLEPVTGTVHLEVRSRLATVLRRTASVRDQEKVHAHLASCVACMRVYLELAEVARHVA